MSNKILKSILLLSAALVWNGSASALECLKILSYQQIQDIYNNPNGQVIGHIRFKPLYREQFKDQMPNKLSYPTKLQSSDQIDDNTIICRYRYFGALTSGSSGTAYELSVVGKEMHREL